MGVDYQMCIRDRELIMDNAEKGLAYACEKTGAQVSDYTAAPVYMDSNAKCRHQMCIRDRKTPIRW